MMRRLLYSLCVFFVAAGFAPNASAVNKYAKFVAQNVPPTMTAGGLYNVSVTLKNKGVVTWDNPFTQCNAYRLGSLNDVWGINRVDVPFNVAPNVEVTFNFTVRAPATPGSYNFQWEMVHECRTWFDDATPIVVVTVTAPAMPLGAEYVTQNVPTTMTPGTLYPVTITMKNTGTATWTPSGAACTDYYRLGSQNPQDNTTWGTTRAAPPGPVAPGQQTTITFNVRAPSAPGNYNFQWEMVHECDIWFGALTPNVVVNVSAAPVLPSCNNVCVDKCSTASVQCTEANGNVGTRICGPRVLRVHPDNPRYFQEYSLDAQLNVVPGPAVLVASYSSTNIVPSNKALDVPGTPGYAAQVAQIAAQKAHYTRVWHFSPNAGEQAVWPWGKQAGTSACYATTGERYNMSANANGTLAAPNSEYWNRLQDAMAQASNACITSEIMLFDKSSMNGELWKQSPWALENNVNNFSFLPTCNATDGSGAISSYCSVLGTCGVSAAEQQNLLTSQRAYVRKMINATIDRNMIYEIENEHSSGDPDWFASWAAFIKNHIATNFPGGPLRLVAHNSIVVDAADLSYVAPVGLWNATTAYGSGQRATFQVAGKAYPWTYKCVAATCSGGATPPSNPQWTRLLTLDIALDDPNVDVVNRHFAKEDEKPFIRNEMHTFIASRWGKGKAINIDEWANLLNNNAEPTDTVPDAQLLRELSWIIVMSGGHFKIEDTPLQAESLAVTKNIRDFLRDSGWNFIKTKPTLTTSQDTFCMTPIQPQGAGDEYLCYYTSGVGAKSVSLPAGSYSVGWWNARTGGWGVSKTVQHGGGNYQDTAPDAQDWVLSVRRNP